MKIELIDERRVQSEHSADRFYVLIYSTDPIGGHVRSYQVSSCALLDAIRWAAAETSASEAYSIGVLGKTHDDLGAALDVLWLLGGDPNATQVNGSDDQVLRWQGEQRSINF